MQDAIAKSRNMQAAPVDDAADGHVPAPAAEVNAETDIPSAQQLQDQGPCLQQRNRPNTRLRARQLRAKKTGKHVQAWQDDAERQFPD